ncbi:MAG TPA: hypothetical protein DEG06_12120 [Lachnospiraceae bacterium]|nr:hypothetical protein [Lachnospiraceae bacterium]
MKKILILVKKHPFLTIFIMFLILNILPPFLINALYKVPPFWWTPKNEIPPGNLLSYFGTVLTFCATFSLSVIIYFQNKENNENTKLATSSAYVEINEGSLIEFNMSSAKQTDILIKFKVNVLSKSEISNIYLDEIHISYDGNNPEDIIMLEFESIYVVFQRRSTGTELYLRILDDSNKVANLIKSRDSLNVIITIKVKCNDVVTPIGIYLDLDEKEEKENKYNLIVKDTHVYHGVSRIEK